MAIRPDQLPRLSGMGSPRTLAQSGNVTLIGVPTATIVSAEGLNVEVRSPYDAVIETTQSDVPVLFEHPVTSDLQLSTLTVAGSNRPPTSFPMNDVRAVSVTQVDVAKTMLLSVGLSLGVSAVLVGVLVAAMPRYQATASAEARTRLGRAPSKIKG